MTKNSYLLQGLQASLMQKSTITHTKSLYCLEFHWSHIHSPNLLHGRSSKSAVQTCREKVVGVLTFYLLVSGSQIHVKKENRVKEKLDELRETLLSFHDIDDKDKVDIEGKRPLTVKLFMKYYSLSILANY